MAKKTKGGAQAPPKRRTRFHAKPARTMKAAGRTTKAAAAKPARAAKPKRPKDQALPGMEDHAIKPLEDVAASYADIRDQRMELTREEHDLKELAKRLMRQYGKTIYRHNGVEIRIVAGEEDVKVKIKKPGEAEEEASEGGAEAALPEDGTTAGPEDAVPF